MILFDLVFLDLMVHLEIHLLDDEIVLILLLISHDLKIYLDDLLEIIQEVKKQVLLTFQIYLDDLILVNKENKIIILQITKNKLQKKKNLLIWKKLMKYLFLT
jgi:hypothetical protein